jgi:predicted transcriptional regulator
MVGKHPLAMCYPCDVQATKQRVKDLLDRLPDDCSLEDVVYHLYIIQKIETGLADVDAGRLIPHEVVAAELRRKWLAGSEQ